MKSAPSQRIASLHSCQDAQLRAISYTSYIGKEEKGKGVALEEMEALHGTTRGSHAVLGAAARLPADIWHCEPAHDGITWESSS